MRSSICLLLFALALHGQETDDEARFLAGLERAQRMMQGGKWEEARASYLELLADHEGAGYVLLRQLDIANGVKLCSFRMKFPEPRVEDLISGKVVQRKKGGWVKLEYAGDRLRDFEEESTVRVHPLTFDGSYTLEIELEAYPDKRFPAVYVGCGTEHPVKVVFGRKQQGKFAWPPWGPATIRESDVSGWEVLAEKEKSPLVAGESCVLKVAVKSGSITAYVNGKKLLSARHKKGTDGQIGIQSVVDENVREILLYGDSQPSWFEGVLDRAFQDRWRVFSFNEVEHLPAWFRNGRPLDAEDEELLGRVREEAESLLEARNPIEAKRVVDEAVRTGIHPRHFGETQQVLAKAVHGPSWVRYYEYKTPHYVVRSDLNERVCHEVAEHLEASLQRFYRDLVRPEEQDRRRYQVFLFSGEAGYQAYVKDLIGQRAENTAGIYNLQLKQLLIWNVPNREDMMRTVRHEGFHQYFDTLGDAPRWLHEGLAEYYENARLVNGRWRQDEPHPDHLPVLAAPGLFFLSDLPKFVAESPGEFHLNMARSYAKSWALIHFLRHSSKENRQRFEALIEAMAPGRSSDEAMQLADVDFAAIQDDFFAHIDALIGK